MFKIVLLFALLLTVFRDGADGIVDCGPPTISLTLAQRFCTELDIGIASGTTEGSTLTFSCKSLLIRTKAIFDYCPVMACQSTGVWRKAQLSCGGATECYDSSMGYVGKRTCTASGKLCQRWDSQTPHAHPFMDAAFPENNLTEAGAYCRDPNGSWGEPWCYTTDPAVIYEACDIPLCSGTTIGQGLCPDDYCGDPKPIAADNNCILLDVISNFTRNVGSTMEYICQSLLLDIQSSIDYCPVQVCKSDTFWTSASISCGANECYTTGQSQLYQGRRTCTRTGKPCQRWDSQTPHAHSYTQNSQFPDSTLSSAGSYCRDPGGVNGQPWCYTTTSEVWDYCGIPSCSSIQVNYGACPPPAGPQPPPPTQPPIVPLPPTTTLVQPLTSPALPPTSFTAMPSTLTSTVMSTTTVYTGQLDEYNKYLRVTTNRNGFQEQIIIPDMHGAIDCANACSKCMFCEFFTVDAEKTCTLYQVESLNPTNIPCMTLKCYIRDYLL